MLFVDFPLLILIFFSLCLIFVSLINMCLGVFLLGFILYGTLCASWTWWLFPFPCYNLFKYFLRAILFLFFWDPCNSNICVFNVVPEVSETVLNSFHSFFSLFCSLAVISTILSSRSLIHFFVPVILL